MGAINIAGVVYLVRVIIAPVANTVSKLVINVEELFKARNIHDRKITSIETVHRLKGCDPKRPPIHEEGEI
jgi:hypothetical protein